VAVEFLNPFVSFGEATAKVILEWTKPWVHLDNASAISGHAAGSVALSNLLNGSSGRSNSVFGSASEIHRRDLGEE